MPYAEFICPFAPFPCEVAVTGLEWFRWLGVENTSEKFVLEDIQTSLRLLEELVKSLALSRGLLCKSIAMTGYSRGAMICLYSAPRFASQLGGIVCYAGQTFGGDRLFYEQKSSPPFLLIHGARDPQVLVKHAENSVKYLTDAEIEVRSIIRPELDHEFDEFGLEEGAAS